MCPQRAAEALTQPAVATGVRDNITVVVDAVQVAGSTVISDRDEVERTRPRVADGVWERA